MKNKYKFNKYKIKNCTKDRLKELGFRYIGAEDSSTYYQYIFPVEKYDNKTTLECKITINVETGNVQTDVSDMRGYSYVAWYDDKWCTNNLIVKSINRKIDSKFKKFEIKRVRF